MSTSQGNIDGGSLNVARRRLALAQEARANATREQIEARGIRPDVEQIIHHMNRTPFHSSKRARLNDSMARRIYEDGDDDAEEEEHSDKKAQEEEAGFEEQWQGILAEESLQDASMFLLAEFRQIARQRIHMLKQANAQWQALSRPPKKDRFDLLGSLCTCTELIVEVCKHLRPLDTVHLYSISKDFHRTISKHMRSSIFAWANYMAPAATRIYSSPVYHRWFVPDPAGRRVTPADQELSRTQPGQARLDGQEPLNENEGEVRKIPGLMWLQMVVGREMRVRDIIACLARRGHRLPEGSHVTLKKIWLIMDAATSQARMILLNNPVFFTDEDLYIAQLFMVKLVLAFNNPIFGPQSSSLMRLMMGQRGLTPLWQLLRGKKYRTATEIRQLKLRYDVVPEQVDENLATQHGVSIDELGVVHFEGWGQGPDHLLRPDQLIPLEAARRQLDLDRCIDEMMIFGHVDFGTGNSLVPSLDEMYMSDDDLPPACKDWKPLKRELIHSSCGNVPFEPGMWLPKHARKARWKTLTAVERAMILEEEQEEVDEIKQLGAAQLKFHIAWAGVAKLTSLAMRSTRLNAKFKVLPPSLADMEGHLHQFARPQRLRLASHYTDLDLDPFVDSDAMDIDSSATPTPSLNLTLQLRPAQRHRQQSPFPDPDDSSNIPDDDLVLDPIPPSELKGIFKSYRRCHWPQSESESDGDVEMEEEDPYNNNNNPAGATTTETDPDQQQQQQQQEEDTDDDDTLTKYEDDFSDDDDEEAAAAADNDDDDAAAAIPLLLLAEHTPATSVLSGNTAEMLLAQTDLDYSEEDDGDDGEGDAVEEGAGGVTVDGEEQNGEGQQQEVGPGVGEGDGNRDEVIMVVGGEEEKNQAKAGGDMEVAGMGGVFGEVDWDHFLSNPGAYTVESEGVVSPVQDAEEETEEDREGMDIEEEDAEEGMEGNMDAEAAEDEDAENIIMLMGGLHVGQGQADAQQVFQQAAEAAEDDEINLAEYAVDEDIGEDESTKKLRDWFRPW
ncbi:hypothetical protein N657DRAFT_687881 [Parathielavia appendiculata]|uniref:Uncharacterized protein n=1 Tax=Parathielavia appendiculata TaxID=2587402 RepID=A0AAN6Z796_9PEZI|nr:hypothetical protein N657DRAFT_687881 [Parathielavia appendiculata]